MPFWLLFSTIPSPHNIARQLDLKVATDMDERLKSSNSVDTELYEIFQHGQVKENTLNVSEVQEQSHIVESYQYDRGNRGCRIFFVGDQGTNKVLPRVKGQSEAAYGWFPEVPEDMHAEGYLHEIRKKVVSRWAMHITREVLGRMKVTDDSFGQMKFQQQNLNHIEEPWQDVAFAFGMAAMLEFRSSGSFPSPDLLKRCKRETSCHNLNPLNKFKERIVSGRDDPSYKYDLQMFNLFGPLQYLYEDVIKFRHGIAM